MPNPVTSGTTQGYFDVANDDRRQTFVYQGPTGPIGYENGKPVYQVSSSLKAILRVVRRLSEICGELNGVSMFLT